MSNIIRSDVILTGRVAKLGLAKKAGLALVVICTSLTPLAIGMVTGSSTRQDPDLTFEVAAVKANVSADAPYSLFPLGQGDAFVRSGGLFAATNQPLVSYVRFALKVGQIEVPGLPSWTYSERFDIQARAQGNPSKDPMRRMMLSLLADRFKMKTHNDSQMKPAFDLVLSKPGHTGPQLQPHSQDDHSCSLDFPSPADGRGADVTPRAPSGKSGLQLPQFPCGSVGPVAASAPDRGRVGGRAVTIERLAAYLTNPYTGVDRPVVDKTGLAGTFDFSIEWVLPRATSDPAGLLGVDAALNFNEALEQQLGLTLKASRAAVSTLVIDHIERPTP